MGEMNEFQATTVLVGLFALRCVLPIVLMAAIAYSMKRLVKHWEREDAAAPEARPAIPLPMIVGSAESSPKSAIPCWVFKNCDESARDNCPAYITKAPLCWLARLGADGRVPAKCADCPLYGGTAAFAAGD